jgi:hypothetical protein
MEQSASLLSVLPNLSIGVVAVGGLVYVVIQFLKALDKREEQHDINMKEQQTALRDVEAHVRNTLANALTQSTIALENNSKVLSRVVRILDGGK